MDLRKWWEDHARQEIDQALPKARQYGSNSLAQVGRTLARLRGNPDPVTEAEALELGCLFYAVGKLERWVDAAIRGEECGEDTLQDLAVYAKMAMRIRQSGTWPGEITSE